MIKWTATNTTKAKYLGSLEIKISNQDTHSFEVMETADRLVFGGACNAGFLESGYLQKEEGETTDQALAELCADLEVFYRDGQRYVSRIVCNDRM